MSNKCAIWWSLLIERVKEKSFVSINGLIILLGNNCGMFRRKRRANVKRLARIASASALND